MGKSMLKRHVCEGGGMNEIKCFSPHLSSELWIYGDRKLNRFFRGDGKMGLIKRDRIDRIFFQCSFLPGPYICVFLQHLLSFVFIFTGMFLGLDYPFQYLHRTCTLTCVLFYVQQYTFLMAITTKQPRASLFLDF